MKKLIKNGTVIDGTGNKRFKSDIIIEDDLILNIVGPGEANDLEFAKIIDAQGQIVAPGFIDTHSHSDLKVLLNPSLEPKVRQGITTEVLGQDGISMAPLVKKHLSAWRKNLAGLNGDSDKLNWDWQTTDDYLSLLEKRGTATNMAYLVPHGNVRMEAVGLSDKKITAKDLKRMKEIVARGMEAGAYGLSSGLIYMPCAYAKTVIELCKVVAEYDGLFVVHQRSEADDILDSLSELFEIAEASGVRLHISHFKLCGRDNWDKLEYVLALLDQAKAKGIELSFDQYPYRAGSTMLGVILPPWAHDGGTDKLLHRLEEPELRQRIIKDIKEGIPGWDNFIDFAGLKNIYITSVKTEKNQDCIGKNLVEIAEIKNKNPYQAVLDLLYEEDNAVGMYDYYGKEEHIIKFMQREEQNFCTDGLLAGKPHPRVYGSFPRVFDKYVRDKGVLSLEEAVYKSTLKAAEAFRIKDRGIIAKGKKADLVIFDSKKIQSKASYIKPKQYPIGIKAVIINGEVVLEQGNRNDKLTGEVLRKEIK